MAYLIADGLILAVLLLFALVGAHRGFILSLCGLLAVLVAFVGASFAARTLSPMVADALEPKFAGHRGTAQRLHPAASGGGGLRCPVPRRRASGRGTERSAGDGLL